MTNSINSRLAWVDNVRMFAMFCVIVGHSFACITGDFTGYDEINLFIVAFNMYLFVFVSGFTSSKGLLNIASFKEMINYINKVLWRVGVPAVGYTLACMGVMYSIQNQCIKAFISFILLASVCVFVYFILSLSSRESIFISRIKFIFPYIILPVCFINQSLWFFPFLITMLLGASLCSFLSSYCSKYKLFCFVFFLFSLSFVFSPVSSFFSTAEFYFVFMLGIIYKVYPKILPGQKKRCVLISLCLLITGSYMFSKYYSVANQFYLSNWWSMINSDTFGVFIIRQLSSAMIVISFVILIKILSKDYNWFSYYGSLTLAIYPIHSLVISILKDQGVVFVFDDIFSGTAIVLLIALLLFAISLLIINLLQRTLLTRIAFLGLLR